MKDFENLTQAMGELDEDVVIETLRQLMDEDEDAAQASQAMEACQKGMDIVGGLFEKGEYFIGDLIYAAS